MAIRTDYVAGEVRTATQVNEENTAVLLSGEYIVIEDQKTSGTQGGQSSTTWATRDLNTFVYNGITGSSLSSNIITIPAGRYIIEASCPSVDKGSHKCRINNITATEYHYGSSEWTNDFNIQTRSFVSGVLSLSVESDISIEHICQYADTGTLGFGRACSFGVIEVYTKVLIKKIL